MEMSSHSEKMQKSLGAAQVNSCTSLPFRVLHRKFYDVEVIFKSANVVYHFYPPKGHVEFPFSAKVFGLLLEDAYVWAVGRQVGAKADYFNAIDAKFFVRAEDPSRSLGQPTFYVELEDVGNRLGAQKILIDRFLGRLDTLLDRAASKMLGMTEAALLAELKSNRWRD